MNWNPKKIEQCNKTRAKTEIKNAIKTAMEAGLYYEDIMQIIADSINETAEEMRVTAEEA